MDRKEKTKGRYFVTIDRLTCKKAREAAEFAADIMVRAYRSRGGHPVKGIGRVRGEILKALESRGMVECRDGRAFYMRPTEWKEPEASA